MKDGREAGDYLQKFIKIIEELEQKLMRKDLVQAEEQYLQTSSRNIEVEKTFRMTFLNLLNNMY